MNFRAINIRVERAMNQSNNESMKSKKSALIKRALN
jgi:hypothetical protein